MAATYLIGIDIGSSFTKSTVVDTDGTIPVSYTHLTLPTSDLV